MIKLLFCQSINPSIIYGFGFDYISAEFLPNDLVNAQYFCLRKRKKVSLYELYREMVNYQPIMLYIVITYLFTFEFIFVKLKNLCDNEQLWTYGKIIQSFTQEMRIVISTIIVRR